MDDLELFRNIIEQQINFSDSEAEIIARTLKHRNYKSNTLLLGNGEICKHIYFILKGCVRTYYISPKGDERTRYISFEGQINTVFTSFVAQSPSSELIETLEDSEVLVMGYHDFYSLVDKIPAWETFFRKTLEEAFIYQNIKIESLMTLSARERYQMVLTQTPHYLQRLSNRILSTYLNISQETLSRLKAK